MELPRALRQAVNQTLEGVSVTELKRAVELLSRRYRDEVRDGRLHLADELTAKAYLATRLPATYAAIRASLGAVAGVRPDFSPQSLLDIGAGPGTALWAAGDCWERLEEAVLIEASATIRRVGERLAKDGPTHISWIVADVQAGLLHSIPQTWLRLPMSLTSWHRTPLPRSWISFGGFTQGMLVIIEPGTPAGWRRILQVRGSLVAAGAHLVAPCPHRAGCPLVEPDWCHFSRRVARSRLHRLAKGGDVPWEDEKDIFIAASRKWTELPAARVLAPPQVASGMVRLKLCEANGSVAERVITRREGAAFKAARRLDWGDAVYSDAIPFSR